jgi:hypothetical protein
MTRLLLVVIVLLVAALCVERVFGNRARANNVRAAVALDSIEAARDTTREVQIALLHDSVRVFVRRAQQVEQRADGLDRALQATRLARLNAQVRVAALDTVVRVKSVTVVRDSVRRTRFAVRDPPYTVLGDVERNDSNQVDDATSVSLHIDLDSIPLQVRLSCAVVGETPVKRALVVAIAPPWARVRISAVEQSLSICNSEQVSAGEQSRVLGFLRRLGVSLGAAIVLTGDGRVAARPAMVFGVRVWP